LKQHFIAILKWLLCVFNTRCWFDRQFNPVHAIRVGRYIIFGYFVLQFHVIIVFIIHIFIIGTFNITIDIQKRNICMICLQIIFCCILMFYDSKLYVIIWGMNLYITWLFTTNVIIVKINYIILVINVWNQCSKLILIFWYVELNFKVYVNSLIYFFCCEQYVSTSIKQFLYLGICKPSFFCSL